LPYFSWWSWIWAFVLVSSFNTQSRSHVCLAFPMSVLWVCPLELSLAQGLRSELWSQTDLSSVIYNFTSLDLSVLISKTGNNTDLPHWQKSCHTTSPQEMLAVASIISIISHFCSQFNNFWI
jgi:hypothetical protein